MSDDTTLPTGIERTDEPSGALRLRWAARTDEGQVRAENEDAVLAQDGLWVVADGMGGHQAGEVASALAIETLRDGADSIGDTAGLADLVHRANTRIRTASLDNRSQMGMGTTLTALAQLASSVAAPGDATGESDGETETEPDRLAVVNVGDSRTYLLRRGRLRRLTVDHSYVQELVNDGQITDEEARLHPRRNIVTRALGIDDTVVVDTWTLTPAHGDRYLLCSDGLVDEVPDHEIADVLSGVTDTEQAADALVAMALRHGGRDNVTVVVVDVVDGPPLPDDTAELQTEPHWAEGTPEPDHWAPDDDIDGDEAATTGATGDVVPTDPSTLAPPSLVDATPHPPIERRRKRPRVATLLFWTVIAAVVIGAFVVVAAYARTGWFVGLDGDDVVIYKGRPGGVLWFSPTVENRTTLTADDLSDTLLAEVEGEPTFGSEDAAGRYIDDLRDQVEAQADDDDEPGGAVTTTTRPRSTTTTTAATTTTGP